VKDVLYVITPASVLDAREKERSLFTVFRNDKWRHSLFVLREERLIFPFLFLLGLTREI